MYFQKLKYTTAITVSLFAFVSCNNKSSQEIVKSENERPNIVLILTDDLGFSDIGAYGSEIETPNIDALAKSGTSFKEFYNVGICAPTRASLLTGQYQHDAGVGFFAIDLGTEAYQGYLNRESVTIAEVLQQNGYATFLSGKWHVGSDSLQLPNQRGFDKFYGFPGGSSNFFSTDPFTKEPIVLYRNNEPFKVRDSSFYITNAITDEAINMISKNDKKNPFFLYLAYNAPHWPLQALPEDIAKYKGKYDKGWDVIREERQARVIEKGIFPKDNPIPKRPSAVPEWNSLSVEEKAHWAAYMEVHAAMIDRLDQNIGKLITHLKATGEYDNTVFFFLSDNGAAGEDVTVSFGASRNLNNGAPVGSADSYLSITHRWAYAANSPFSYWKTFPYEGGISSPFIASYPGKFKENALVTGRGHLIDIYPTILELTGVSYPKEYANKQIKPLVGNSLTPYLIGKEDVKKDTLFFEWAGNKAVRAGNWKILSLNGSKDWKLFNILEDRGETKNIASNHPEIVNTLNRSYKNWAKNHNVGNTDSLLLTSPNAKQMIKFRETIKESVDN